MRGEENSLDRKKTDWYRLIWPWLCQSNVWTESINALTATQKFNFQANWLRITAPIKGKWHHNGPTFYNVDENFYMFSFWFESSEN